MVDSLEPGGAERVALGWANFWAHHPQIERSYLCATRKEGGFKELIDPQVEYLFLEKRSTLDWNAIGRLNRFVRNNKIGVIHAHSSSFFLAWLIKWRNPQIRIIWHDHFGRSQELQDRPKKVLSFCSRHFHAIVAVNESLKKWSEDKLHCTKVVYLPNGVQSGTATANEKNTLLEGSAGSRVICVANFRPQKDHQTLIQAFELVKREYPESSLHLIGKSDYPDATLSAVREYAEHHNIGDVYFLGEQMDIKTLIGQADIGVLSSYSEGLPISLLEYGTVGLPVVATAVGQIPQVLEGAGILVSVGDPDGLAKGIMTLLSEKDLTAHYGNSLKERVEKVHSYQAISEELILLYQDPDHVL